MTRNTVIVRDYLHVREEFAAGGAVLPGHLIALGSAGTVAVHGTANGAVYPMFAVEDELQGKTIDDAYSAGNLVFAWIPTRGDVVNALLCTGETVAVGDMLCSHGDGTLEKFVSADVAAITSPVVGIAVEALANASGSAQRLLVKII